MPEGDERLRSVLENCRQVEKDFAGICIIIRSFDDASNKAILTIRQRSVKNGG